MSDKIFDLVEDNSDFEIGDDYVESLIKYSISGAISDLGYYWRQNALAEALVNDKSFQHLWSNYKTVRQELLGLAITSAGNHDDRHNHGISKEFSKSFIKSLYEKTPINVEYEDNKLRTRLIPHVEYGFDYLAQLCEYSIDPSHEKLYLLWRKAGMVHSVDDQFYDHLFSKVKRERGSTDTKVTIVEAAFENGALSDNIIKRVAKSSPKKLKRTVVSLLSGRLSTEKRSLDRAEGDSQEKLDRLQKIVDNTEQRVMLFVSCDDNDVVSNLIDCLSKDNLPWLMPSASKHPWLGRRLQQKIDYLLE